jgi:HAD superfamily hydrolase (TIGR01490 family)
MIHIFDVDYTVIKKTSTSYFLREALRNGTVNLSQIYQLPFEWIRYKLGHPNMDFLEDAVKRLAGIEKNILEQTARSCFERYIRPNIYSGAAKLIRGTLAQGKKVIFATSSLYALIQPLEQFFGIEGSIASRLEFSEGKSTGKLMENSFFGPRKKDAVEAWLRRGGIRPDEVNFYSDSYTDLPLLEFCGRPVAVNPDRILAREAKKRGWEILRFTKTLGFHPE